MVTSNKLSSGVSIEVSIDRQSLIFRPNDTVSGVARIKNMKQKIELSSYFLRAEGALIFNHPGKKNSSADALANIMKPHVFFKYKEQLNEGKAIGLDKTEIPFKFKLETASTDKLMESYTGVYIVVYYEIEIELKTPLQAIKAVQPFYVQVPFDSTQSRKAISEFPRALNFMIQPDQVLKGASVQSKKTPNFKIAGKLRSDAINLNEEIEGTFLIGESDNDIKSIDLQLVRVETVETNDVKLIEATEVQNIQIADGNVMKKVELPIFMVLPRFYSCPTFAFKEFSVNFELNLIFLFAGGFKVTQNFPLFLFRPFY